MKLREDGMGHEVESLDESFTRILSTFLTSPMFAHVHIVLGLFFFLAVPHVGTLGPQPGIEPTSPAVEAWSPNHWTAREVPILVFPIQL